MFFLPLHRDMTRASNLIHHVRYIMSNCVCRWAGVCCVVWFGKGLGAWWAGVSSKDQRGSGEGTRKIEVDRVNLPVIFADFCHPVKLPLVSDRQAINDYSFHPSL